MDILLAKFSACAHISFMAATFTDLDVIGVESPKNRISLMQTIEIGKKCLVD